MCRTWEVLRRLRRSELPGRWLGGELAFGLLGRSRRLGTPGKSDCAYWPEELAELDSAHATKPLMQQLGLAE